MTNALLIALTVLAAGCATVITPFPGPLYLDPNGNARLAVAVAGPDAGAPCLEGPVCLLPQ